MVVLGRWGIFGFFGKEDNIVLSCKDIELIGKDTILVRYSSVAARSESSAKKFVFEGSGRGYR